MLTYAPCNQRSSTRIFNCLHFHPDQVVYHLRETAPILVRVLAISGCTLLTRVACVRRSWNLQVYDMVLFLSFLLLVPIAFVWCIISKLRYVQEVLAKERDSNDALQRRQLSFDLQVSNFVPLRLQLRLQWHRPVIHW